MTAKDLFHHYFDRCALVAIIRGVTQEEAEALCQADYDAGIRIIEVPLNSPDPIESIRRLAAKFSESMLVGGGTVLDPERVGEIKAAGGRLIVAPNTNVEVIEETVAAGLVSCPGYFTPSDAFDAIEAGATALKLFPAEGASPAVLKAQRAVIPKDVPILAVGGVKPETIRPWLDAGADGFGLGGGLYQPGQSPAETRDKARAYVAALKP